MQALAKEPGSILPAANVCFESFVVLCLFSSSSFWVVTSNELGSSSSSNNHVGFGDTLLGFKFGGLNELVQSAFKRVQLHVPAYYAIQKPVLQCNMVFVQDVRSRRRKFRRVTVITLSLWILLIFKLPTYFWNLMRIDIFSWLCVCKGSCPLALHSLPHYKLTSKARHQNITKNDSNTEFSNIGLAQLRSLVNIDHFVRLCNVPQFISGNHFRADSTSSFSQLIWRASHVTILLDLLNGKSLAPCSDFDGSRFISLMFKFHNMSP